MVQLCLVCPSANGMPPEGRTCFEQLVNLHADASALDLGVESRVHLWVERRFQQRCL